MTTQEFRPAETQRISRPEPQRSAFTPAVVLSLVAGALVLGVLSVMIGHQLAGPPVERQVQVILPEQPEPQRDSGHESTRQRVELCQQAIRQNDTSLPTYFPPGSRCNPDTYSMIGPN